MTINLLRTIFTGLIVLAVEIGISPLFDIDGARPDLLLIFVIIISVRNGKIAGLLAGFIAGLAQDAITLGFLGVYAFAKSSLGFWLGVWLERRQNPFRTWMWLPVIFICAFLQFSWHGLFTMIEAEMNYGSFIIFKVAPAAVYTGFVGYLWALAFLSSRHRKVLRSSRIKSGQD